MPRPRRSRGTAGGRASRRPRETAPEDPDREAARGRREEQERRGREERGMLGAGVAGPDDDHLRDRQSGARAVVGRAGDAGCGRGCRLRRPCPPRRRSTGRVVLRCRPGLRLRRRVRLRRRHRPGLRRGPWRGHRPRCRARGRARAAGCRPRGGCHGFRRRARGGCGGSRFGRRRRRSGRRGRFGGRRIRCRDGAPRRLRHGRRIRRLPDERRALRPCVGGRIVRRGRRSRGGRRGEHERDDADADQRPASSLRWPQRRRPPGHLSLPVR